MIVNQQTKKHPWGEEIIWAKTERYAAKFLKIKQNMKLDKQYHNEKEETVYVLYGTLVLEVDNQEVQVKKGQSFHIAPGQVHRYCSTFGEVDVIVVSNSELEDVVRLENGFFKFN